MDLGLQQLVVHRQIPHLRFQAGDLCIPLITGTATAIGKGGCTYADACLKAGISTSTFQLWKQKGQEQDRGQYSDFSDELKRAEADFRAHHLKRIQEAANESSVETAEDGPDDRRRGRPEDVPGGRRNYAIPDVDRVRLAARAEVSRAILP